jgi:SAGA-associated factor 29
MIINREAFHYSHWYMQNKDVNASGTYKVQFEDDNNEIKYASPNHVLETHNASK